MARIVSELQIVGPIGEISAYRMRGHDKIIVRKKGGASKERIKKSPAFERTREVNMEFGGRAAASKYFMQTFQYLRALADYNIAGKINALFRPIQIMEHNGLRGQRNVLLTRNPKLLEGFSLNRITPFDSVIQTPLHFTVSRETMSASIELPELVPGINFYPSPRHPMCRIIATLGIMPDLFYHNNYIGYRTPASYNLMRHVVEVTGDWFHISKGASAKTIEISLEKVEVPDQNFSVVLSLGLAYGEMSDTSTIQQAKYAGCAKVVGIV